MKGTLLVKVGSATARRSRLTLAAAAMLALLLLLSLVPTSTPAWADEVLPEAPGDSSAPAAAAAAPEPSSGSGVTDGQLGVTPEGEPVVESMGDGSRPPMQAGTEESRAMAQAAAQGAPVEIVSQRGVSREVFALPSGDFETREYVVPKWTNQGGVWARIDTTLEVAPDGSVTPVASTVDLEFSGGGTAPLVRMERLGRVLELSWPEDLPKPVVEGDSVLYQEVFEGVDLQLRATEDGFASYVIVKTAAAARNPKLARLSFGLGADGLKVSRKSTGVLEAADAQTGAIVFEAPAASMWENANPAADADARRLAGRQAVDASVAEGGTGPGKAAPVKVEISDAGRTLTLLPNAQMLSAPETQFPVVIDPVWHTPAASGWTSPNKAYPTQSYWKFKGAATAGVGTCQGWTGCSDYSTYRVLYQFDLSRFHGSAIQSAQLFVPNTHSAVCSNHSVTLWHTGGIDANTTWNTQNAAGYWIKSIETRSFHYGGNQAGCNPPANAEFNVRALVQEHADANHNQVTVGLIAGSETDKNYWKRFGAGAYLQVQYNHPPDPIVTSRLTMNPGGACAPASSLAMIRTLGQLTVSSLTDPDPGETVWAYFQVSNQDGSWLWGSGWVPSGGKASGSPFSVDLPSTTPQNTTLWWRVTASDGPTTSAPSAWCAFKYDITIPPAPTIASTRYPASNPSDPADPWHDGVGNEGKFTMTASNTDVAAIRYGVNANPTPTQQLAASAIDLWLIPNVPGVHFVTAQAIDAAGNASEIRTYQFRVGAGRDAVDTWTFDDQSASYSLFGDAHVTIPPAAEAVNGAALALDGEGDYATTTAGTVDSAKSYSVEAWVRLDSAPLSGLPVHAVLQGGPGAAAWVLRAEACSDPAYGPAWVFGARSTPAADSPWVFSGYCDTARAGEWSHVVAVHSAVTKTVRVYVDGVAAGVAASFPTPWTNSEPTKWFGHATVGGVPAELDGLIDGVRVYDRTLTPQEIDLLSRSKPAVASRWTFDRTEAGTGTTTVVLNEVPDGPVLQGTGVTSEWGRVDDFALALSSSGLSGPVSATTTESFTVGGWFRAAGQLTGPATVLSARDAAGEAAVQVRAVPSSDPEAGGAVTWELTLRSAASGGVVRTVVNDSAPWAEDWHHITVVYDAQGLSARLFIDGVSPTDTGAVQDVVVYDADTLFVGAEGPAAGEVWPGAVDDTWVLRGVLTNEQIYALAVGQSGYPTEVPGGAQ